MLVFTLRVSSQENLTVHQNLHHKHTAIGVIVFNRDDSLIQDPIRLHSSNDLAEITELAQDRKW